MSRQHWDEFYATNSPPSNYDDSQKQIKLFCEKHHHNNQRIVLVTSGGTTVPLEHNTVRFVDNFSGGVRGAASTEYFLKCGYAVIFLHRFKSVEPFTRHFGGQKFLEMLDIDKNEQETSITVKPEYIKELAPILVSYKTAHKEGRLLCVNFTTLSDYFWLLRAACESLTVFGSNAMLYLAAAVSDFFIPPNQMSTHKISSDAAPSIHLQLVPKLLTPIVSDWLPNAFVVSFKLETDPNILINKARGALTKYKHKLVIGNMLHTRRTAVIFVKPDSSEEVRITQEQAANGVDLEDSIVTKVIAEHSLFIEREG
ncbi:phosphopantothenate--cysteine ligase [Diabrotica undecimpunctata]|uniref:phosphopantothenate--cysteine ligase n=1 Tax=Diabrotica undecimpunctata TaxID=50387 RepID=UPI003B63F72B